MATHVIVGAGQAGGWAAIAMRQAGFDGRILLIGDEAWRPYERPPLSKAVLTDETEPPLQYFHTAERYAEQRIELLLGTRVSDIDPKGHSVELHDGARIEYDRLLLTMGGRARHLPIHGGNKALYLRTIEDARQIRERLSSARQVLCIGAGVIGLEIASSARARGCDVTVLEALPRAMGRSVSPEGAAFIEITAPRRWRCAAFPRHRRCDRGHRRRACCASCVAAVGSSRPTSSSPASACNAISRSPRPPGSVSKAVSWWTSSVAPASPTSMPRAMSPPSTIRCSIADCGWSRGATRRTTGSPSARRCVVTRRRMTTSRGSGPTSIRVNLQVAGLPADAVRTVVRANAPPNVFTAIHLAEDGSVVGVTAANNPREIRAGQALIKSRRPVSEAALGRSVGATADADPALKRVTAFNHPASRRHKPEFPARTINMAQPGPGMVIADDPQLLVCHSLQQQSPRHDAKLRVDIERTVRLGERV